MALPHKAAWQDPVTRGGGISIVAMTLGDVVLRLHPEFPQLESRFTCKTLAAEITPSACKANFQNRHCMSCQGCPVGSFNAGVKARTKLEIINDKTADRHTRNEASRGLHCVRCGRSSASSDFVGNMRLVRSNTCCVSCYNREREVKIGENSKGAKPVLHRGLRPTTLVIMTADGKRKTVDIGMSTGPSEARRHAERRQFELLEIWIDGARGENAPDLMPEDLRKQAAERAAIVRAERKKKPLRIANDREAAETEDKPLKRVNVWLPPMTPEQASAYKKSFENDESVTLRGHGLVEDITSERFGRLIVIESDEDELICDYWRETSEATLPAFVAWLTDSWPAPVAGDVKTVAESNVQSDFHGNVDDITGRRFGLLSVIARDGSDPRGHASWRVRCDCGSETIIRATDMKTRKQVSCGCFFDAAIRQRKRNTGPLTESEIVEWNERVGTKRPEPVVVGLTWCGRALTEIAAERGEDLEVIESRMLATGSPFPDTRKAVRPPPQLTHNESAVPSDPVSDAIAPAKPVESVVEPPVEPQVSKKPEPAVSKRALHPLLVRLGFRVAVLYGSVMPLVIEQYRGPKSLVLFGCLCSKTFYAPAQAVLRGHTKDCGCGIKPEAPKPSHDLATYLRTLRAMPPIKLHMGTTHENHVAVGVRAYVRSAFVTR